MTSIRLHTSENSRDEKLKCIHSRLDGDLVDDHGQQNRYSAHLILRQLMTKSMLTNIDECVWWKRHFSQEEEQHFETNWLKMVLKSSQRRWGKATPDVILECFSQSDQAPPSYGSGRCGGGGIWCFRSTKIRWVSLESAILHPSLRSSQRLHGGVLKCVVESAYKEHPRCLGLPVRRLTWVGPPLGWYSHISSRSSDCLSVLELYWRRALVEVEVKEKTTGSPSMSHQCELHIHASPRTSLDSICFAATCLPVS